MAPPPDPEELEAFGISADFQDFVRSLNYGTFRWGRLCVGEVGWRQGWDGVWSWAGWAARW